MKAVLCCVIILAAIFVVNAKYTKGHDGRPNCDTAGEMKTSIWRNNNDPTTYWVCSKLNTPAVAVDCPMSKGFVASKQACVDWSQWRWEEQIDPPTMTV